MQPTILNYKEPLGTQDSVSVVVNNDSIILQVPKNNLNKIKLNNQHTFKINNYQEIIRIL